jgi:hypothetical protein
MKIRQTLLATALGVVLAGSVSAAPMSASQAHDLLTAKGYTDVEMLQLENDVWLATAFDANGQPVDVRINTRDSRISSTRTVTTTTTTTVPAPKTIVKEVPVVVEKVVERPVVVERVVEQPVVRTPVIVQERILVPIGGKITKDDVRLVLEGAGYYNIHDIDYLSARGVWKAEARDSSGDDREIHVNPIDARIVHVEDD